MMESIVSVIKIVAPMALEVNAMVMVIATAASVNVKHHGPATIVNASSPLRIALILMAK